MCYTATMKLQIVTFLGILLTLLALSGSRKVSAHEGTFSLKNAASACEGISVWKDDRYHLVGRCAGLVYPYQERLNNYVLWVQNEDQIPRRVTNINLGLFDGYSSDPFTKVFVTVEENSSPRNPGNLIVASANLRSFDFGTLQPQTTVAPLAPSALITPTPTAVPVVVKSGIAKQTTLTLAVLIGVILAIFAAVFIVRRGN